MRCHAALAYDLYPHLRAESQKGMECTACFERADLLQILTLEIQPKDWFSSPSIIWVWSRGDPVQGFGGEYWCLVNVGLDHRMSCADSFWCQRGAGAGVGHGERKMHCETETCFISLQYITLRL